MNAKIKQGTTPIVPVHIPQLEIEKVDKIYFTFAWGETGRLTKAYPDEVSYVNDIFVVGLSQEDTASMPSGTVLLEAQINFIGGTVAKTEAIFVRVFDTIKTIPVTLSAASDEYGNPIELAAGDIFYGVDGSDGATFVPHPEVVAINKLRLSWTNDQDLPNPDPVEIEAPRGEQGEKGEDGHTPEKGVDYWTADDKAEIIGELETRQNMQNGSGENAIAQKSASESENSAISKGSAALGEENTAGLIGYYISKIDLDNKIFVLTKELVDATFGTYDEETDKIADFVTGYDASDRPYTIVKISNNTLYMPKTLAIESIDNNIVTYSEVTPEVTAGKTESFTQLITGQTLNEESMFFVPTKPDVDNGTVLYDRQFVSGVGNIVTGRDGFSSGRENIVYGPYGAATGRKNEVNYASFASGQNNKVVANYGRASGINNEVYGTQGAADGSYNVVLKRDASASGRYLIVDADCQRVIGKYNASDPTKLVIIGNGNGTTRNNAVTVDYLGNVYADGGIEVHDGIKSYKVEATTEVQIKDTNGNVIARLSEMPHNILDGSNSGIRMDGGTATGASSVALVLGNATADYAIAMGYGPHATASHTLAIGRSADATAVYAMALGMLAKAKHAYAVALGDHIETGKNGQIVLGSFNVVDNSNILVLGNGTSSTPSNAMVVSPDGDLEMSGDVSGSKDGVTHNLSDKADAADLGGLKLWSGTQAQYDAITSKDANTLYFIKEGTA